MKNIKLILLIAILIVTSSCKDYLNMVPKNQKVVSTPLDLKAELLAYWASHNYAIYPLPTYGNFSLSLPIYNDVITQLDLYEDNINFLQFRNHQDITEKVMKYYYQLVNWKGLDLANSLWQNGYSTIGLMSSIIDDLAEMSATTEERELVCGEAKVIRAWSSFKLLEFFSPYNNNELGIPLNYDSENVEPLGRSSQSDVFKKIISELTEVLGYTSAAQKWNFFYNKNFINSFLAEIYMYKAGSAAAEADDWSNAEKYSASVISDYVFEDNAELLKDMFKASSIDVTVNHPYCALKIASKRSNWIGNQYTGIWGLNNAQQVDESLWMLYDADDIRKSAWFKETTSDGVTSVYIAKPVVSVYGPVSNIQVFYRKADMFLINLEALCHLGKSGEAAQKLSDFRKSRIPGYAAEIGSNVLDEVLLERRRELCFENGSRWIDMKRLGVSCTRLGLSKEDVGMESYSLEKDDYRYALPIPVDLELNLNNNVKQNPGWINFD